MKYKKGFLHVLISNLVSLIISLFTGFVLPNFLSINSYADIKLFQLYITYTGFLHFGYSDGMYLKYGGKEIDELDRNDVYSSYNTFCVMQLLISLVILVVSIFLKSFILFAFAISILPINTINYIQKIYQASGNFKKYARFSNLNNILILIVNIILLFIIKTDNSHVYITLYLVVYFFIWFILIKQLSLLFGNNTKKISILNIFNYIKDGFLVMIGNFCAIIFTSFDRLLIKVLMNTVSFAYYSFAVSLENILNILTSPMSVVMYNYLYKVKEYEKIRLIKRVILIASAILISVIFPIKFIVINFITKYSNSLNVLCYLFLAQFFSILIRSIHNNLYKVKRKQKKYFKVMIFVISLALVLNIVLYMMIKSIESFAIATLITSIIWLLISEEDFKESKLKITDYIYILLIVISLIIFYNSSNVILGFVLYIIVVLMMSIIFMRREIIYIIIELKKTILPLLNKG